MDMILGKTAIKMLCEQHGARSKEELIERILCGFKDKTIKKQLRQKQVTRVFIDSLSQKRLPACLIYFDGHWHIRLGSVESEWSKDVGHELIEIYFVELERILLSSRVDQDKDTESFCEDFAARWAKMNERKFRVILRAWEKRGSPDCLFEDDKW